MSRFLSTLGLALMLAACSQQGSSAPRPASDSAQQETTRESADLAALMEEGLVELVEARGNGASSGNAVNAVLRNTSGRPLKVDIVMDRPLYFRNRGVGQNMIASMVLAAGGGYLSDGSSSFIELPASRQTPISVMAYCADFKKDNPGAHEHFTIDDPPPVLATVMERIQSHVRQDPTQDIMAAAQVAVWLVQGVTAEEIAERFEYSPADLALARRLASEPGRTQVE